MSLFKVKQWWSNDSLQESQHSTGIHNAGCLIVDKFTSHSDSDCILLGEEKLLKVYKPNAEQDATHLLLEIELNDVVLQLGTGKFLIGIEDRQILVLHPQGYVIFELQRKAGHTDAGDQNSLQPIIKHSFTRKAHSLTFGPFGNSKSRDLICIQALDGSLSFFDQDTFLFMCVFDDVIIPGPVSYISSSDCFIICKSTWVMEIYSYQQLKEFSELTGRQNKKNIPQWVYNSGEEVSAVQVIKTSNNFSSILALGERHLFCFQDNGLMKYMIKFDYIPLCFCAYLIGWYYELTSRLLVMVASDDSKLFVYESTTMLWSCDLLHTTISISRCFLKSLPGGLATLSNTGVVTVSYLGTEPDLNSNAAAMANDNTDIKEVQSELEVVEEELQKIINSKGDDNYHKVEQIIAVKADVGKLVQNLSQQYEGTNDEALHLLMCPLIVILKCEDPKLIQSVQITYACSTPFTCSESINCFDNVNGTEIIENQVFVSSEAVVMDASVIINFTVTDTLGKIYVFSRKVVLPLSLYCVPTDGDLESRIKLNIETNQPCVEFSEIFTDYVKEDLATDGNANNVLALKYRSSKKKVVLKSSDQNYLIEAMDYAEMTAILNHFMIKLNDHYMRKGVKNLKIKVNIDKEFVKQIIYAFLKSIEVHAKERTGLKKLEDELAVLQKQFHLVQKKLLVQYGSLPPGDCDPLEFLMKDTHGRIVRSVNEILKNREIVCRSGNSMAAIGALIIAILKQNTNDAFKIHLVEQMLALDSIYEHNQEWEETVTQSAAYIIKNVFNKSDKEKEKLAPVTEQGVLSQINLKRFLKQIRIILDRMFTDVLDDENSSENEQKITRIEEMVELI